MPTPALLLLIATLLPLGGFVLLMFLGRRLGNPLAGYVGTAIIGASFVFSVLATIFWVGGGTYVDPLTQQPAAAWGAGQSPIFLPLHWVPVGTRGLLNSAGFLDLGIYVDSLTVAMFSMVTAVATLVHIFSLGYMHADKRFPRFFTYLGLFCFSMLGLVLGGTALHLFVFWELVGLCSYLLIGFWYEKKSASNAAIKAFVVNRVGDFGFLIGFGILFYHLGNVNLPTMWAVLGRAGETGNGVALGIANGVGPMVYFPAGLLTAMGIGLFCGAIGKSAQFPLHVWLPDAMEGPTPVSALIHAATMVAAGVYLVARIFPILTPDARLFIAIIGCITLTMAALIAIVQTDIKRVLAFSTLSQLGYMILAMGVGSWVGGLFHLITHAFFKALLFLGSGSVIFAAHHVQEMPRYGGLLKKIPVTAVTFGVAVLAIAGTPFFSGFYSKDMIVHHAAAFAAFATGHGGSHWYWLLFALPTIIAYVTAFYMTRCWMLTFWGRPRDEHVHGHAHERPVMWFPLVILAVLSLIAGYRWFGVRQFLTNSVNETKTYCTAILAVSAQRQADAERVAGVPPQAGTPRPTGIATTGAEATGHAKPAAIRFTGFDQAWPVEADNSETAPKAGNAEASRQAHPAAPAHAREGQRAGPGEGQEAGITAREADERGEERVAPFTSWLFYGFVGGIGLGFLLYARGIGLAERIRRIPPLNLIHTWLLNRMYFDELYFFVFVSVITGLAKLSAAFDRYVVDGLVNGTARVVKNTAFAAGWYDQHVVDGAVNGVGHLTADLGTAVRNPASGRVRLYVTLLMIAVALGLAGAVVAVLSK